MPRCSICGDDNATKTTPVITPDNKVIDWGQGCTCSLSPHQLNEAMADGSLRCAIPPREPRDCEKPADVYDDPNNADPHLDFPRR